MSISKKSKLVQNPDIIDSQIDDEIVMMDVEKGAYFGLDPVGSSIWGIMEKPHSIDDVTAKLTQEYDVKANQCKADIKPFLERLIKTKLLIEVDE